MSERGPRRFPRWEFDLGELEVLLEREGWDGIGELERACHLRSGRLDELVANGWQPYLWEFRRMALVLDMDMDELAEIAFKAGEQG